MSKRRLGRGLDALLGRLPEPGDEQAPADLSYVSVETIDANPFQPRQDFSAAEMSSLVESILQHGILQPVVLRPVEGRYQLVAGERRLRAAKEAGLGEVPARVLELDDQQVFELAIVENLQRQDLNPLEKARAFQEYLQRFGGTQEELSARLGVDRSTLSNLLRLLELPEEVQQALRGDQVSAGHARALLSLGTAERQIAVCRQIIEEGMSVRQVEALVSTERPAESRARKRSHGGGRKAQTSALEQELRERLGTRVDIRQRTAESGQVIIHFHSQDDFQRILDALRGEGGGMMGEHVGEPALAAAG